MIKSHHGCGRPRARLAALRGPQDHGVTVQAGHVNAATLPDLVLPRALPATPRNALASRWDLSQTLSFPSNFVFLKVTLEAKMIKIPKQEYTAEFKEQAVKRVTEQAVAC